MREKKQQKNKEEFAVTSDYVMRYFCSYLPYCIGWFYYPYNWMSLYYEPSRYIDDVHSHKHMELLEEKENRE